MKSDVAANPTKECFWAEFDIVQHMHLLFPSIMSTDIELYRDVQG